MPKNIRQVRGEVRHGRCGEVTQVSYCKVRCGKTRSNSARIYRAQYSAKSGVENSLIF